MLLPLVDPTPSDNDVVAGWGAFGVFILLLLAVAFLGWSMVRQFRKVNAARQAGVFGEEERREAEDEAREEPQTTPQSADPAARESSESSD